MSTQNIQHIGIIMDGNRRWATKRGLPKIVGHTQGSKTFKKITTYFFEQGIPYITVWALSTENFKERSEKELDHLFSLIEKMSDDVTELIKNKISLQLIGDISKLPEKTQSILQTMVNDTSQFTDRVLTLAINYGGRDELTRAMKSILHEKKKEEEISEDLINTYLDTRNMPDVDLIIRTGGAKRLSGFMPWQSVYAELYFTNTLWPSFTKKHADNAIDYFNSCKRNKGK